MRHLGALHDGLDESLGAFVILGPVPHNHRVMWLLILTLAVENLGDSNEDAPFNQKGLDECVGGGLRPVDTKL